MIALTTSAAVNGGLCNASNRMSRQTVLLVEDNVDLRSLFSNALSMAHFAVREAADGMEALRLIDSAPPDVIVLDLGLPHVTGHDVLQELRQHPHTRKIPVVIITGSNDPLDDVEPACVLRKPVDAQAVVRQVERCLEAKPPSRS